MTRTPRVPARDKSRGVAALEFALSLTFLVPLLMGMLDFGYYFWISTNAEEAARAGVREAVMASKGSTCGSPVAIKAQSDGQKPVAMQTSTTCDGGAAYCHMNEAPLKMGGPGGATTVTLTCLNGGTVPAAPVDPTWRITVQVDFYPAMRFFSWMMPQSAVTPGKVKYTATVTSN
jgi:Flp pilus assembly protein TadG